MKKGNQYTGKAEKMMKKRCMALTLAAVMAFSVTAFGASNPAQNGKWESAYGSGTVSAYKKM